MIEFSEYDEMTEQSRKVWVNPAEVAAVREWNYHSFRPAISEIVLQSGEKIRVWEVVVVVMARLNRPER